MKELQSEMSDLRANNELLEESLNEMADRYRTLSWDLLNGYDEEGGLSLEKLQELEQVLSDMAATNPLMKRAAQLRHSYVFGKGVAFKGLKPQAEIVKDDPVNERALFSVQAFEEMNLAKFCAGNFFVLYNKRTKLFTRVPLSEISGLETDPESSERIWHIKRRWKSNGKHLEMWYPLNTTPASAKKKTISKVSVSQESVMFHETSNKQVGWALGVPDALAAMSWAIAYSNYLKNNSTLVKAYAQFAFKVSNQTKKGIDNSAAKIAQGGVGGTALQALGNELTPVNATGSQVNFNNGQPLAAMVASSLGVSVIALLSSPGAAGGSYGAAATLDGPTLIGMATIQDTWTLFFKNVFKYLKSKDVEIAFPAIESDPVYRQIASLTQAYFSGGLHQEEYRAALLALLDVPEEKAGLPKPDFFNNGQDPTEQEQGDGPTDPVSRQGNSGAVAGGTGQGDTNNDGRSDTISGND